MLTALQDIACKIGLRQYNQIHIDEVFPSLSGTHENELFFNCTFDNIRDLTLKNCVLSRSRFETKGLRDALGFTLTLDCHSFRDVQWSEDLFDMFLLLACKTKGNTEKRKKLLEIIGKDRAYELLKQMETAER